MLFNDTAYFGPAHRVAATVHPRDSMRVQKRVEHVVLSRNEYGAGYYHLMHDTIASLAFMLPMLQDDPSARFVLNTCSIGREHHRAGLVNIAPDLVNSTSTCTPRPYVASLLRALGVPAAKVQHWPYTRQPSGPVLEASRATFMCAHPFRATYHRSFWYVRQLRLLLHQAFGLPQQDGLERPARAQTGSKRLVLLVNRRGCAGGCNPTRNVRGLHALLDALKSALPGEMVLEFTGNENMAEQARLFNAATLIIGPHGAALSNAIWCGAGTDLIEFHRLRYRNEPNSPLYALYSRLLMLRHWVVIDTKSKPKQHGYQVDPGVVIATARAALASPYDGQVGNLTVEYPNWIPFD